MLDVLSSLKGFIKIKTINIDDGLAKIHYKLTATMLLAFSLLLTTRQYLGDPINCMVDEIPEKIMNTYCWIHSTFTIPDNPNDTASHPGVRAYVEGQDQTKNHRYYQWVCFVLFFQALLFLIPHYMWKAKEKKRVRTLVEEAQSLATKEDEEWKKKVKAGKKVEKKEPDVDMLVEYFFDSYYSHNTYFYWYVFHDVLNFVNVIGQIFFMDFFLDGEFSEYGSEVIRISDLDPNERLDPMSRIFPKVTKCTFNKFGASGTLQNFDGLCVLPLNILNEKIYVFLWFWFVILAVISALTLIYRTYIIFSPNGRARLTKATLSGEDNSRKIVKNLSIGKWFLFYQVGKSLDPIKFSRVTEKLAEGFTARTDR